MSTVREFSCEECELRRRSCTCSKILELAMHSLVPLEVPEVRESSRGAVSCLCCFFEDFADDDTMTPALTPFLFFWWMFLLPFVVRASNQFEKKAHLTDPKPDANVTASAPIY